MQGFWIGHEVGEVNAGRFGACALEGYLSFLFAVDAESGEYDSFS